jgi:hypothetical protein
MRKKTKASHPLVASAAERVKWIKYKGVRILHLDFSGMPAEGSLAMIDAFEKAVAKEKPDSLLMLSSLSGAEFDASVATRWRRARVSMDHLIKRSALEGAHGLVLVAVKAFYQMMELMGFKDTASRYRICEDAEKAKAWLIK